MTLEYLLEQLGYELTDNIVRRCKEKLDKIVKRPGTKEEYTRKVKRIIAREA